MRKMLFMAVVSAVFAVGICKSETANAIDYAVIYNTQDASIDSTDLHAMLEKVAEIFTARSIKIEKEVENGSLSSERLLDLLQPTIMFQIISTKRGGTYNFFILTDDYSVIGIPNPPKEMFDISAKDETRYTTSAPAGLMISFLQKKLDNGNGDLSLFYINK